jgi:hypothetical protein
MSSINPPSNNTPKKINRFNYYLSEVLGLVGIVFYVLGISIVMVIAVILLFSILSFPYYWYMYNTSFVDHISSIFLQTIQFFINSAYEKLQEIVDYIFGAIILFILIGCIYPFMLLSNFLSGNNSNNTTNKFYKYFSIASVPIVIALIYYTYFQSNQVVIPITISVTPSKKVATITVTATTQSDCCTTQTEARIYTGTVNIESLRIRAAPSVSGKLIARAKQRQIVYVYGESNDGNWLFVEYQNNKFGWTSREFITMTLPSGEHLPFFNEQSAEEFAKTRS